MLSLDLLRYSCVEGLGYSIHYVDDCMFLKAKLIFTKNVNFYNSIT